MFRTIWQFAQYFLTELCVRKSAYQRIRRTIRAAMLARHENEASLQQADAIIQYKLGHFRPRVIGGIVAMRLLFEVARTSRRDRRAGSERFMLMWLFLSALSDMLDGMSPASEKDARRMVYSSLLLRTVYLRILVMMRNANMSGYRLEAIEMLFDKLRELYIIGACTDATGTEPHGRRKRRQQYKEKLHIAATLMWYMLYPQRLPGDDDIQILAGFAARTKMIDDIADVPQDIFAKNQDSAACIKLVLFPSEYDVILKYAQTDPHRKMNPWTLKRYAPHTYAALRKQHARLGDDAVRSRKNPANHLLRLLGDMFFLGYPILRNCIYFFASHRAVF